MSRILVPSAGPDSWQQFLAKPELQWRRGYSARTLAHSWETANGLPPEVERLLRSALGPVELLLAIPELKTPLPGGRRESQSDVFALVGHKVGTASCTIEGKVEEPFGPTVGEWSQSASLGKQERLSSICRMFGWTECAGHIRYQLLHRTAAALIEAERFGATHACMLVHSFSARRSWFSDFREFTALFGVEVEPDTVAYVDLPSGKPLVLGWASGELRFLDA